MRRRKSEGAKSSVGGSGGGGRERERVVERRADEIVGAFGGDERAADASATRDRTASRGDAQSRPSQSSADIRAITLSTVLKIPVRAFVVAFSWLAQGDR